MELLNDIQPQLTESLENSLQNKISLNPDSHTLIDYVIFRTLVYFTSGEISNPLAIINNQIQEIQRSLANKELGTVELQKNLMNISHNNSRLSKTLRFLKNLSDEHTGLARPSSKPFFLLRAITEALGLCQGRLMQKQLQAFYAIDPKAIVYGDSKTLVYAILLLIKRALDLSTPAEPAWIQLETKKNHNQIELVCYFSGKKWGDFSKNEELISLQGLNIFSSGKSVIQTNEMEKICFTFDLFSTKQGKIE